MVTYEEYQQQLEERRKALETTKSEIEKTQPQLTAQQLRQIPLQQRQKALTLFGKEKETALSQLQKEFLTQQQLEAEFKPQYETYQRYLTTPISVQISKGGATTKLTPADYQQSIEMINSALQKGKSPVMYGVSKNIREFVSFTLADIKAKQYETTKDALKHGYVEALEGSYQRSIPKLHKMELKDLQKEYKKVEDYFKGKIEIPEIEAPKIYPMTMPEFEKKFGRPPTVLKPGFDIKEFGGKTYELFAKEFPERAGMGYEEARKLVPYTLTGYAPVFKMEEAKTPEEELKAIIQQQILTPTLVSPFLISPPRKEYIKYAGKERIEIAGPKEFRQVGEAITGATFLSTPGLGEFIGTGMALEGYKITKEKIPTVKEVMNEALKDFSQIEKEEFLNTEEGKILEEEAEAYVSSLKTRKKLGYVQIGIGALPVAGRVGKFVLGKTVKAFEPFKVTQVVEYPQVNKYLAFAGTTGKKTTGFTGGMAVLPRWVREGEIPMWKVWQARLTTGKLKVPVSPFEYKPIIKVTAEPFAISGKVGYGIAETQRVGRWTTLRKAEQILDIQQKVGWGLKKLPEYKALAERFPPMNVFGMKQYAGLGWVYKGKPMPLLVSKGAKIEGFGVKGMGISPPSVRLLRVSAKQKWFEIPTKKMIPTRVISISRVKKIAGKKGWELYGAITEERKLLKKGIPLSAEETGYIFIKRIPKKAKIEYFGKGKIKPRLKIKQKQVEQKQVEQAVSQIAGVVKFPKIKVPKIKQIQIKKTSFVTPRVSQSLWAGTGLYEKTEGVSGQLFVPPKEREKAGLGVGLVVKPLELEKLRGGLIEIGKERQVQAQVPFVPTRIKTTITVIPKEKVREKEVLGFIPRIELAAITQLKKPSRRIPRRPRPPQPPRPRPKRVPPPPTKIESRKISKKPFRLRKEEVSLKQLFIPEIRRYGRWFPISKPLPKKKAIAKGISKLRETLAASLRLRKGKEFEAFGKPTEEFTLKKGVLIQRRRMRLKSPFEVSEIRRRRKGGLKFI